MATIVEEVRVSHWPKVDVVVDESLLLEAMAEVESPLNRFGTWKEYGEGASPDRLRQHYISTGAWERLLKRRRFVYLRQHALAT